MAVKVKVEGLREVQKALRELPKKSTRRNVLKRVGMRRMEAVAKAARALVPVDQGNLRESISVGTRAKGGTAGQAAFHETLKEGGSRSAASAAARAAQRADPTGRDVQVFVGPAGRRGAPPHAHMIEFGTKDFGPEPYMRPAWDREKHGVLRGIENDLWAEIQRAAKRAARKAARAGRGRRR